jgi:hypothetical protein
MTKKFSVILVAVLLTVAILPQAVRSQQQNIQDMIVNGSFEGGFQEEFGVGYGWGGFSNGNAVVGWSANDWDAVAADGQYSQRLEIKDALDKDRIVGLYQTVSVIPGEQYRLILQGLIRSEEGNVNDSDYGYRVQYAIDFEGRTAWELLDTDAWQELPWDEQPLALVEGAQYRMDVFDTTVTAKTDRLTLFVRGWKKWLDNGTGVFNLDAIRLIGPAPEGFQSPVAQAAVTVSEESQLASLEAASVPESAESPALMAAEQPVEDEFSAPAQTTLDSDHQSVNPAQVASLPATGAGDEHSLIYIVVVGSIVLLALFTSAITATARRRNPVD